MILHAFYVPVTYQYGNRLYCCVSIMMDCARACDARSNRRIVFRTGFVDGDDLIRIIRAS